MRHFVTKAEKLPAVKSDRNGPVQRKMFETSELYKGQKLALPYKAAKPYTWCEYKTLEQPSAAVAIRLGIDLPDPADVFDTLFRTEPDFESSWFKHIVDDSYAVNGALENAQAYGDLLMFVTAMEAKETLMMIRNIFVRLWRVIFDLFKSVKRLNLVATLDVLSDLWLEYRYGWRPLMGEISSVAEQLTSIKSDGIKSSYGTYKGKPLTTRFSKTSTVHKGDTKVNLTHDISTFDDYTVKTGFNYVNKQNSRNVDWQAIWGLDWQSLASTAWELVPFSFVIDFFLNIGNMLQARDVHDQVDSFNGWMTCKSDFNIVSTIDSVETKAVTFLRDYLSPEQVRALANEPLWLSMFNAANKMMLEKAYVEGSPHKPFRERRMRTLNVPVGARYSSSVPGVHDADSAINYYKHSRWGGDPYKGNYRIPVVGTVLGTGSIHVYRKLFQAENRNPYLFFKIEGQPFNYDNKILTMGSRMISLKEASSMITDLCNQWIRDSADYSYDYSYRPADPNTGRSEAWNVYGVERFNGRAEKLVILNPDDQARMKYGSEVTLLQRVLRSDFSHRFQSDRDLSSGQWADLATLGYKIVRSKLS